MFITKFYNQFTLKKRNVYRSVSLLFIFFFIFQNCKSQTALSLKNNTTQYAIDKGVMLEIMDCKGEFISKTVTIDFKITNTSNDTNRVFITDCGYAKANHKFACSNFKLGENTDNGAALLSAYLAHNQAINGSITYYGNMTNLKTISSATLLVFNNLFIGGKEIESKTDSIELFNIDIDWAYRRFTQKTYMNLVSIGLGFQSLYVNSNYSKSSPPNVSFSYERKINPFWSVGANISYASYQYTHKTYYGNYSPFTSDVLYLGLNTNYVLNNLIKEFGKKLNSRIQPYLGLSIGIESVYTENMVTNTPTPNKDVYTQIQGNHLRGGFFFGVRYSPIKNLYLFGELGNNTLSLLNLGTAFRFN